jgi:hypothetical protein
MSNTQYANTDSHLVSSDGGAVTLTVAAGATSQMNSGTSIPCKVVYLNGLSTSRVHCAINTSTNVSYGIQVPVGSDAAAGGTCGHLELAVDDVSKIWVFASLAASIHLTYRL